MKLELKKEYELKDFEKLNFRQKEQLLLVTYMQQLTGLPFTQIVKQIIDRCYPIKVKPDHKDYSSRAVSRSMNKKQLTNLIENHLG